jgi:hypothetical protein
MTTSWAFSHKKIKFVFNVPEISLPPSTGVRDKQKSCPLHLYMSLLSELHYVLSEHKPFRWQWKALLNYERSVTHCVMVDWQTAHCFWVVHAHTEQEATALTAMLYINTINSCVTHHLTTMLPPPLWGSLQNLTQFKSYIPYCSMLLMYNHTHCHSRCTVEHMTMPSVKVEHFNIMSSDRQRKVTMYTRNSGRTSDSEIEIVTVREERLLLVGTKWAA